MEGFCTAFFCSLETPCVSSSEKDWELAYPFWSPPLLVLCIEAFSSVLPYICIIIETKLS